MRMLTGGKQCQQKKNKGGTEVRRVHVATRINSLLTWN